MTDMDMRSAKARQLEEEAAELRKALAKEHLADFPEVGERIRYQIPRGQGYYSHFYRGIADATVRRAFPPDELIVEFDEWEVCDKCGQKTHKKWDRINFDQILIRHLDNA